LFPVLLSSVLLALAIGLGSSFFLAVLDRLNRAYQADLIDRMSRLGMPTDYVPFLMRSRWILGVLVWLAVWFGLGMLPVGILLGVLSWHAVALLLEARLEAHRLRIRNQLVDAAQGLATQMRGGLPLQQGLAAVARDLAYPLGDLLRRLVNQVEHGQPMRVALLEMKDRLRLDGFSIFAISLIVAEEKGGDLTRVLDRLSHSLEEMERVENKRLSDTSAGRLLVLVLSLFPIGFLTMYYFLDPEGTSLVFSLFEGQVVLAIVGLITYGSWRWAQYILAPVE
jgi:Flp pilus assembly protein TadB